LFGNVFELIFITFNPLLSLSCLRKKWIPISPSSFNPLLSLSLLFSFLMKASVSTFNPLLSLSCVRVCCCDAKKKLSILFWV